MPDLLAARTVTPDVVAAAHAGYRWFVGDLRTGKISRTIGLIDSRWSSTISDDGTLEGSFPLRSGEWSTARSDSAPAKQFLAVSYVTEAGDETFLAGGPIWTSRYDDSTGVLQVGAAALSSYYDHRKVMPVLAAGANPAEATVTYTGAQLGLIAKRLIELAHTHTGGSLPVVLPSDTDLGGAGTTHTRTYPGYELGWVGERLQQLTEVEGGPEIQFVPRRRSDDPRYIEWVMRIGVQPTMLLTQAGAPWIFDRTVPKSPIRSINVDTNGSEMTERSWAAGQGEAEGRPIVFEDSTALVDAGWPLLESEVTSTDTVSDDATLRGHARADLAHGSAPIETWTVVVDRDARPNVGLYSAGDWCKVRIRDHDYLPDGDYDMRILFKSGDASASVTLQMVPRLAGD